MNLFIILQDADKKGLSMISEEVKNLAEKAKQNSLKPEDYEVLGMFIANLRFFSIELNECICQLSGVTGRNIYSIQLGWPIRCKTILRYH